MFVRITRVLTNKSQMFFFSWSGWQSFCCFPPFEKYSSQKTCCTHPLRRRRGGTKRSVLFRAPTRTLWMLNVQVQFLWSYINTVYYWSWLSFIHLSLRGKNVTSFGGSVVSCVLSVFSRLLQDHDSVQPCSDSCAVCWLFNSPVSAHWRQSTSHRGSVLTYKIHFTPF